MINAPMEITHIPLNDYVEGMDGNLYRGSVPWTIEKKGDKTFSELKARNIATIILLCPPEEYKPFLNNHNLKDIYNKGGITVHPFYINSGESPEVEKLREVIGRIEQMLREGKNVLVHCLEGKRRTGCVIASFAAQVCGISAKRAMRLFTKHVGEDIKWRELEDVIRKFAAVEDEEEDSSEEEVQQKKKCVIC